MRAFLGPEMGWGTTTRKRRAQAKGWDISLLVAKRVRWKKGVLLGETIIISDRQVLDDVCNGFEILPSPPRQDTGNNAVINALYNTSMNIMDKLDGLAPSAWPEALDDYHREGLINKTSTCTNCPGSQVLDKVRKLDVLFWAMCLPLLLAGILGGDNTIHKGAGTGSIAVLQFCFVRPGRQREALMRRKPKARQPDQGGLDVGHRTIKLEWRDMPDSLVRQLGRARSSKARRPERRHYCLASPVN
ncbi:uncharacterized protein BKA55DRAFT_533723 [Fusarium redolens]|uniref:Uncharacterized protein n=1 Tax=Fusarium redolens TaxID=48865 RepID=A0A9P9KR17_FUSRE|nr:uncharacterized protein BKA55DRAFT_533723 [Fusarium redolens]KAH7266927.1 hypothetical protein BKA55DRAFT_533723 [Fusarium redolens]